MDLNKIIPPTIPTNNSDSPTFLLPCGSLCTYPQFKVLSHTVDTVSQFYDCKLDQRLFLEIDNHIFDLDKKFREEVEEYRNLKKLSPEASKSAQKPKRQTTFIDFEGRNLAVKKMGKVTQYAYSFQDQQYGIQFFLKSHTKQWDVHASHVKVTLSPQFLSLPLIEQKDYIHKFLNFFCLDFEGSKFNERSFEMHYAIDFQVGEGKKGIDHIFPDYQNRVKGSRSNKCAIYESLKMSFDAAESSLISHGRNITESVRIGPRNGLQTEIYIKDLDAKKKDKLDYFADQWGDYDKNSPVFRLESRAHQTVLQTYELGTNNYLDFLSVNDFSVFFELLSKRFRVMDHSGKYLDPLWFLILQSFDNVKPVSRSEKHYEKRIDYNEQLTFGNFFSMLAKQGKNILDIQSYMLSIKEFESYLERKLGFNSDNPSFIDMANDFFDKKILEYFEKHGFNRLQARCINVSTKNVITTQNNPKSPVWSRPLGKALKLLNPLQILVDKKRRVVFKDDFAEWKKGEIAIVEKDFAIHLSNCNIANLLSSAGNFRSSYG